MTHLELMNTSETNISNIEILKPVENLSTVKQAFTEINTIKEKLLDKQKDFVKIKGKTYITKSGYRKIAIAFSISTEVVKEKRIEVDNIFIYDFTVRAVSPIGRYMEASASCSSDERSFNHLHNDVRATAQTRATNRSISDLIGLGEVSFEEMINESSNKKQTHTEAKISTGVQGSNTAGYNNTYSPTDSSVSDKEMITYKQKRLLIKLVEGKYQDEQTRNSLYKKIDTLSKEEARITIRDMIEEGVEFTA